MKKYMISLSLSTVLLFVGCGGSSDDKGLSFDVPVDFKTAGTYDLRAYVIPNENSINTYQSKEYENKEGKKSFKGDPVESIEVEKYDVNATDVLVKDNRDQLQTHYKIQRDRIVAIEVEENIQEQIARFADKGDYLVSNTQRKTEEKIPVTIKNVCQLVRHYDEKKIENQTYEDLLEVKCKMESTGENKGETFGVSYISESEMTLYFEKGTGEVYSESIECDTVITNLNGKDNKTATCTKEMRALISHNRL